MRRPSPKGRRWSKSQPAPRWWRACLRACHRAWSEARGRRGRTPACTPTAQPHRQSSPGRVSHRGEREQRRQRRLSRSDRGGSASRWPVVCARLRVREDREKRRGERRGVSVPQRWRGRAHWQLQRWRRSWRRARRRGWAVGYAELQAGAAGIVAARERRQPARGERRRARASTSSSHASG